MTQGSKNNFDSFATLMDKNIKGVQYGVYAVAGLGFVIALRSVRPFKIFRKPSDIPPYFIQKQMKFSGRVVDVQGGQTPILRVDHYPVIALPIKTHGSLPIKISSVDVTPNGGIWLNTLLPGHSIDFIPLRVDDDVVHCIAYRQNQNIGQHLVSIGFGTVGGYDSSLTKNVLYNKYYKSLLGCERDAESSGSGVWQANGPSFTHNLFSIIKNFRYSFS